MGIIFISPFTPCGAPIFPMTMRRSASDGDDFSIFDQNLNIHHGMKIIPDFHFHLAFQLSLQDFCAQSKFSNIGKLLLRFCLESFPLLPLHAEMLANCLKRLQIALCLFLYDPLFLKINLLKLHRHLIQLL